MKQIDAGALNVGYAEAGPADGQPVILLHGWPYDIHTYAEAAPLLAAQGFRVIVPYLRGYGSTRFLSGETPRNGQQSVVAVDIVALMDALGIEQAILGGCDWGARTANVIAALWPERCKAMVSVSGYLIGSQAGNRKPLPPKAELAWWYQFYFATDRGREGYDANRRDFAKLIWQLASPKWQFDEATFERSAAAFDNPDHVDIVIHNYRWRLGLADGEPQYDALEQKLAAAPDIAVPTITLEGDAEWRSPPGRVGICEEVHGAIRAPASVGRHRPQPAPGSTARVRSGDYRRERDVAGQDTKRYPDSGGWGFGRFIDGKPVDAAQHETCFACHEARVKGHDFVFTRWAP